MLDSSFPGRRQLQTAAAHEQSIGTSSSGFRTHSCAGEFPVSQPVQPAPLFCTISLWRAVYAGSETSLAGYTLSQMISLTSWSRSSMRLPR
jgi:hypothetical protein